MKRTALLLVFVFLLAGVLVAQEPLLFVAENETVAFTSDSDPDHAIVLNAGDIVTSNAAINFWQLGGEFERFHLIIIFEQNNRRYFSYAKYFRPLYTENVFDDDIFIEHPFDRIFYYWNIIQIDAMWVPYYYANILRGQDRNMLLEIHPTLNWLTDRDHRWYEISAANIKFGRTMFYNSAIMLGSGNYFAVRNIQRTDFGYIVDCVVSTLGVALPPRPVNLEATGTLFQNTYWFGDAVTLLLFLDGDYLDIYTYGSDIHVGTFIRVGREFIAQYQSLIRHNTSDLTNVQWPQRAGVSRAFPPPVITAEPPPEVAEPLIAVPVEAADIAAVEAPPIAAQNAPATGAMPPLAWLAIGGAVLAAAGGGVAVRRKR